MEGLMERERQREREDFARGKEEEGEEPSSGGDIALGPRE